MNKAKLIQLIHIAKSQLGLDDDTYRDALAGCVGKRSCKDMNLRELNAVLVHFQKSGFKTRFKRSSKRISPKSKGQVVDKLRAIWITMHQEGFVRDGSETALDSYINRILNTQGARQKAANVTYTATFLTEQQAIRVLEILKKWHKRELINALIAIYPARAAKKHLLEKESYTTLCKAFEFAKGAAK